MRGVITAPNPVITGAFTLLFSFPSDVPLTRADIEVETLEGDALGHAKDSFGGSGSHYHLLCYLPDERAGKSRISVSKAGVEVVPVVVEYDTIKTVRAVWGTPEHVNRTIEVPLTFEPGIRNLRKRNFSMSAPRPFQLYVTDTGYNLVVRAKRGKLMIVVWGAVEKMTGIPATIPPTILEV